MPIFKGKCLYTRYPIVARALGLVRQFPNYSWMKINHSTLDYHVTNFNTLSRWLFTDKSKL